MMIFAFLTGNQLVELIKNVQNKHIGHGLSMRSWKQLVAHFKGIINGAVTRALSSMSYSYQDKEDALSYATNELYKLLKTPDEIDLTRSSAEITNFIIGHLKMRVNRAVLMEYLGKVLGGGEKNDKTRWEHTYHQFRKELKREPDMQDDDDVEYFAKNFGVTPEKMHKIFVNLLHSGFISLNKNISGEDTLELIDTISDPRAELPDKLIQNNEIRKLLTEFINQLPPVQKKVMMLKMDVNMDDELIAKELGKDVEYVRVTFNNAKQNLMRSKGFQQLKEYASRRMFIKVGTMILKQPNSFFVVGEKIIQEIIKRD